MVIIYLSSFNCRTSWPCCSWPSINVVTCACSVRTVSYRSEDDCTRPATSNNNKPGNRHMMGRVFRTAAQRRLANSRVCLSKRTGGRPTARIRPSPRACAAPLPHLLIPSLTASLATFLPTISVLSFFPGLPIFRPSLSGKLG